MNSHVVPLRASLLALAISFLLLPVPEPAGLGLLAAGILASCVRRRKG